MQELKWPYANEFGQEEMVTSDVLVLSEGRHRGEGSHQAQRFRRHRL